MLKEEQQGPYGSSVTGPKHKRFLRTKVISRQVGNMELKGRASLPHNATNLGLGVEPEVLQGLFRLVDEWHHG